VGLDEPFSRIHRIAHHISKVRSRFRRIVTVTEAGCGYPDVIVVSTTAADIISPRPLSLDAILSRHPSL